MGILKNKTILLVNHNIEYLKGCNSIIVIRDGLI
jgi:ABC-type transport system involved in cytochrome bd biosynthesis fused ATPase/permease subunit